MTKRRIKEVWGGPDVKVVNSLNGKLEVTIRGEKLTVAIGLDEYDARQLVMEIRKAFGQIRKTRRDTDQHNFAAFEEQE